MNLIDDNDWRAVHFDDRTILSSDRQLYPKYTWEYLLNEVEVEPMKMDGHYKAVSSTHLVR